MESVLLRSRLRQERFPRNKVLSIANSKKDSIETHTDVFSNAFYASASYLADSYFQGKIIVLSTEKQR